MKKLYLSYYPIRVSAEQKTSKAGKQYTSICICHKTKYKDGNKKDEYINLIDEKELLVISSACESMYHKIVQAKNDDHLQNMPEDKMEIEPSGDDIPF